MYQVTSAAPASQYVPNDAVGAAEAPAGSPVEPIQPVPESGLRADDHGTLPDQGAPCVSDESVPVQGPPPAQDSSTQSVATTEPTQRPSDAPQDRFAAAFASVEQAEPVEPTRAETVQAAKPTALPNVVSPPDNSAVSGGTVPPAGDATATHGQAENPSSSGASDSAPIPCKISAQLEGSPSLETPIFLVDGHEPAVRLSSLLDLVRSRLSADNYQRLRESRSAEAIVSIRDLASAGFTFQVVDGRLAISVNG